MEILKCTKVVATNEGTRLDGSAIIVHRKCGLSAAEYKLTGQSFTATAVLCGRHKSIADREIANSMKPKKGKPPDPRQIAMEL